MSKIVPPDRCSAGFQTHLERRFAPDRFGGSAIRQVWKPALNKTRLRRVAQLRDSSSLLSNVKNVVHCGAVISEARKTGITSFRRPSRGAFPGAPAI
jgi:hypothetical protein